MKRVRYYACTVCNYMLNALKLETDFRAQTEALAANKSLLDAWVCSSALRSTPTAMRREIRDIERRLQSGETDKSANALGA